jgi:outer membrane usher protein FimD/PapC
MPGVHVALENRPIGRTGDSGRLFVTGLNSYVANAISVDPLDLPIDSQHRGHVDHRLAALPRRPGRALPGQP